MSSNPLNFAPYSSPPSSPRHTTTSWGNAFANGDSVGHSNSNSGNSNNNKASRPKSPWFSAGSYQSGAKASDLNTNSASNHISSSSYHSATSSSSAPYAPIASTSQGMGMSRSQQSGDVLFDAENGYAGPPGSSITGAPSSSTSGHDAFETAFGWRVDVEAAATYVLGPMLAMILLILETKNDYVRFHAWQSLMLGAGLGVLHLLLLWSRFFTWTLVLADLGLYGSLTYRAFIDGNTLERYFLPRIGEIASQWTEEE